MRLPTNHVEDLKCCRNRPILTFHTSLREINQIQYQHLKQLVLESCWLCMILFQACANTPDSSAHQDLLNQVFLCWAGTKHCTPSSSPRPKLVITSLKQKFDKSYFCLGMDKTFQNGYLEENGGGSCISLNLVQWRVMYFVIDEISKILSVL